ncbi:MAG: diguanylate cyclase [Acidobacteriota bacterium]|nr:diguanylate cyclase [Acidobacteriota bacterium]
MEKLAILYDASQAVLSTFDLDEVLKRILAIVREQFRLENGAIFLLDSETRELKLRSSFGRPKEAAAAPVPTGSGLTGAAAQLRRPVYAPEVSKDPRYLAAFASTRSELSIPLMVRENVVGVLDFQSEQANFFSNETVDLLTLFSTQASIAIENARLHSLEERRAAQLETINALAKQTAAVLDLKELLPTVCALVLESFPVDQVAVLLKEGDMLVVSAQQGRLTPLLAEGARLPVGSGLAARAMTSGKTVVENDVRKVGGYVAGYSETVSEMCLPLVSAGQPLGVLALESAKAGAFRLADLRALESVADICAIAIQNAHYFEQARRMAFVDGLTGVYNRRYFEQRILEELERAARYSGSLAVLMLDIDHFKRVNDEFGHLLGDEVLRQLSTILAQQLRKVDVVCRYGGEEFSILVPQTTGEHALGVAEKLRKVIEDWNFPGVPRPVTVSIGVADFPEHGATRDELVKAADAALYAAKQAGRNRVFSASARA